MNAVTRLGIVPVRANSSDSSEMISQLLYGERCYIRRRQGIWSYIESKFDDYKGWVDTLQITEDTTVNIPDYIITSPFLELAGQYLPMGSEINHAEFTDKALLQQGVKPISAKMAAEDIARHAEHFLKTPYLWGGKTFFGVDCSGLTQTLYKVGGYTIPRDSGDQEKMGKQIVFGDFKSGDLAFFSKPGKDKISHVGIITGNHELPQIIHASSWVKKDRFTPEGIIDSNGRLTHQLLSIKSIIGPATGSE
ncbi:MAG: C40 family peptidase [Bacteroidetes bacterium]|nr:C40 family peptidase [Bacteroidota bacterium]